MYDLADQGDFYRKPDAKDLPGWTGPATITDMSEADRGIIIVNYRGRKLVCDPQNLRQHLAFLCFFFSMAPLDHPCTQAMQHLYIQIANLPSTTTIHLGYCLKGNVWQLTKDTAKHTSLWNATRLPQILHTEHHHAATRISNHPTKVTSITDTTMGYYSQTLLLWEQGQTHPYPYAIHSTPDLEFNSMKRTCLLYTSPSPRDLG